DEEEEAADRSGDEEEHVATTKTRPGSDPWDISDGSSGEEAEEEDDEEEEEDDK
ncbi:unnamed protein product, partial [Closterium sp. NIES-53]